MLVSCLTYFSVVKMDVTCSSEMVDFPWAAEHFIPGTPAVVVFGIVVVAVAVIELIQYYKC